MTLDTETRREYACADCCATETILKGNGAWWYAGWEAEDGRKLRVPTTAEMHRGIYGWQPA